MAVKRVYVFGGGKAEGNRAMKDVLGGKGAGLAEMTNLAVPVPPGFTISTEACSLYYRNRGKLPQDLKAEIAANLAKLERTMGRKLGDPKNPLLVSVRSGAKFSMPGMMDTVLNLGLNDKTAEGLARMIPQSPVRVRFLLPLPDDVLQRGARAPQERLRTDPRRKEAGARRRRRRRPGRRRPDERVRRVQGAGEGELEEGVPAGPADPAGIGAGRGVPVLEQRPGEILPEDERDSGRYRDGGERPGDGVRKHGRRLRHRRRLYAKPRHGRQGVLRRVSRQRAGRGRHRRHTHPAPDPRYEGGLPEGLRPVDADYSEAGEALQGRAGFRVHHREQHLVHAPDAEWETDRGRGRQDRRGHGQGEADHEGGGAPSPRAPPGRPAAASGDRPESQARRHREGASGLPRRSDGRGGLSRRQGGGVVHRGEGRDPGPEGDEPDDIHGMDVARGILTARGG